MTASGALSQLTIFCSRDLEDRVVTELDRAAVEGFFRLPGGTGNKFRERGGVPRTITWEATMFVVPAAPAERVEAIVRALESHAGSCEIRPCLRMTVAAIDLAL